MIKLEVSTHSGSEDVIEVEQYDVHGLVSKLNDPEIQSIALGDNIYSRIDVKNVKPVRETTEEAT